MPPLWYGLQFLCKLRWGRRIFRGAFLQSLSGNKRRWEPERQQKNTIRKALLFYMTFLWSSLRTVLIPWRCSCAKYQRWGRALLSSWQLVFEGVRGTLRCTRRSPARRLRVLCTKPSSLRWGSDPASDSSTCPRTYKQFRQIVGSQFPQFTSSGCDNYL